MAIAIRSNGRISHPFLSAGTFTAALAVRETYQSRIPSIAVHSPDGGVP